MREDKGMIVMFLMEALKHTEEPVVDMHHFFTNGCEYVDIFYKDQTSKRVEITAFSGVEAMLKLLGNI